MIYQARMKKLPNMAPMRQTIVHPLRSIDFFFICLLNSHSYVDHTLHVLYRTVLFLSKKNVEMAKLGHFNQIDEYRDIYDSDVAIGRPNGSTPERILAAGQALFFRHGFQDVSTDDLARVAAVSKTSIYRHFGDMNGLLQAVVTSMAQKYAGGIDQRAASSDELIRLLSAYGERLLKFLSFPMIIAFDQLIHERARKTEDVARLFYDSSYENIHRSLSTYLYKAKEDGLIDANAPVELIAEILLMCWTGLPAIRSRLGLEITPFPAPAQRTSQITWSILKGFIRPTT